MFWATEISGTHADAKVSIFTAFGPSGMLKMFIDMIASKGIQKWASKKFNPKVEMFFAPSVINELLEQHGKEEMERMSDCALTRFVDAAIDNGWIKVNRSETIDEIQQAYLNILEGKTPPSEAVILSMTKIYLKVY